MICKLRPGPLPWWLIPVASLLSGIVLLGPGMAFPGQPHLAQMLGSLAQVVTLAVCLWAASRGRALGLGMRPFWSSVGLAFAVMLGLSLLFWGIEHLAPALQSNSAEALRAMGAGQSGFADLALVVTICGLAPLGEELLYRGVVLKGLYDLLCRWGLGRGAAVAVGLLASSVGFALAHAGEGQSVGSLAMLGMLGLALGGLYVVTGQLWVAVLGHAINNCFAISQVLIVGDLAMTPVAIAVMVVTPVLAVGVMAAVARTMKNGPAGGGRSEL